MFKKDYEAQESFLFGFKRIFTGKAMLVPVKTASTEEIIKGSRFLAESFLILSQDEVRKTIKSQKQKYSDATHVCHAFILGKKGEIMGMSDDGEPGGTAGRPMLDVLKGRKCTNILVTVTRWFGGTLLGTGGLVHAYSGGAKNVLDATAFEELVEKSSFCLKCGYQNYKIVKKALESFKVCGQKEEFGEEIAISGEVELERAGALKSQIFDATNGKVLPIIDV